LHVHANNDILAKEVCEKLYQDAKYRNMSRERQSSKNSRPSKSRSHSRNPKSDKYLLNLFIEDFQKSLIELDPKFKDLGCRNRLNYFYTSEVVKRMGFMYTDANHNDKADERMLFIDFWRSLRGDENDGVDINNLKTLLLIIEGIKNDTRKKMSYQEKGKQAILLPLVKIKNRNCKELYSLAKLNDQAKTQSSIFDLVEFSSKNSMKINPSNYMKIRKYFITFARNRSEFLRRKINKKLLKRHPNVEHEYKPKLDKKSRKIVKGLHSKLNELKIPHYELLLYKGKEYDKRREMSVKKSVEDNKTQHSL
jgi:hypothetical protein